MCLSQQRPRASLCVKFGIVSGFSRMTVWLKSGYDWSTCMTESDWAVPNCSKFKYLNSLATKPSTIVTISSQIILEVLQTNVHSLEHCLGLKEFRVYSSKSASLRFRDLGGEPGSLPQLRLWLVWCTLLPSGAAANSFRPASRDLSEHCHHSRT